MPARRARCGSTAVSAFILARLDYCNSLLSRLPGSTIQLHWLPVEQRIIYKLCLFMHYIHIGLAPKYVSDFVSTVSAASSRYRLGSIGSAAYVLPRTRTKFGERGFFYSGPAAWNTLPSDLHDITDTSTFQKRLMYFLIVRTTDYCWRSWTSRIAAPYKSRVDWLIDWRKQWLNFGSHPDSGPDGIRFGRDLRVPFSLLLLLLLLFL